MTIKYLFTPDGEHALHAQHSRATLCAFDFDGTLAPIVPLPAQARTPIVVQRLLATLATLGPVAVVSGRSVDDLVERVPRNVQFVVGNHGNEGVGDEGEQSTARAIVSSWMAQLRASGDLNLGGVLIENKGISLSVHYRLARDRIQAARLWSQRLQLLEPTPSVLDGKLVFNVLPPESRTKLEALIELARRTGAHDVLFVGDDVTDEIVFARAPAHWLTVRVELKHGSRARFFVHRQAEVAILLDVLVKRAQQAHGAQAVA